MTDVHSASAAALGERTLVSWRAILAGAIVAIAVGAMLNLLGLALGAASLNPFSLDRNDGEAFSALAGLWVAVSNLIGLFVGGFVATRASRFSDHHRGMLLGLSVWALAFLFAIAIAGATTAGGVTGILTGAGERAAIEADLAGDLTAPIDARDVEALPPPVSREAVDDAADTTGAVALWAFLTMLLGAVGSVLGARYGARIHSWERKADAVETTSAGPVRATRARTTPTV